MLMKGDDKKKSVSLIMSKMLGKPEVEEAPVEDGAEQDDSVGMEAAADELLQAIEMKSSKGIVQAIKSMIQMASSEPESPIE
jgi:hypothetical protein